MLFAAKAPRLHSAPGADPAGAAMIPVSFERPAAWIRMRLLLLVLLSLLFTASDLPGQQPTTLVLQVGDRVRLLGPLPDDGEIVDGQVVEVSPYGFAFFLSDRSDVVFRREYSTLDGIDVGYRSPGRSARGGAFWGLFLGSALGVVAGPLAASNLSLDTDAAMLILGAGGGLVGSLTGAAAGATIAPIRWNRFVFQ